MSTELEARQLIKKYGGRAVVKGVNMNVAAGEIVGLLGPNGAGKTTTFLMMVGLKKPDEGTVYLNGREITSLPLYKRAKRGIGYLPQEPSIFRNLTIRQNFQAILELVEPDPEVREKQIVDLLSEFDLRAVKNSRGSSLSGGERRRVEIARALIPSPDFLLLDEPFAGIDPIAVEEIQKLVKMLKEKELGVLITDHNVRETLAITDRSYIMNQGEILFSGGPEEIKNHTEAQKIYLGNTFATSRGG